MAKKTPKVYIKTLFNKNHIKVESEEYILQKDMPQGKYITANEKVSRRVETIEKARTKKKIYKFNGREYTKETSKLGFYYYKPYRTNNSWYNQRTIEDHWKYIEFCFGYKKYKVSYLTSYGMQSVSVDQRPWNIAPEGSMADHFVTDLLKVMNNIFDEAATEKLQLRVRTNGSLYEKIAHEYLYKDLNIFKREIYTQLFGSPTGPKYQTDLEKIESHGFDTKISFRNRKEQ